MSALARPAQADPRSSRGPATSPAAARGSCSDVRPTRLLLGLLALAALLLQGGLFVQKSWLWTGDYIYHRALIAEILNGELLPGGPYAGLPAFYSPLLHELAAGLAALFRLDPLDGVKILSALAAPATPLVAFYLARVLGFGRWVALAGAYFATFGGGLKLTEDRVWVDALFVGQHNFFPLFPRDAAFLLLPLGLAWTYRGLIDGWRPGPYLAGLSFGLIVLVHTQTAVFAAPVLGIYLALVVAPRPALLGRALRTSAITAGLGLLVSSVWWAWMVAAILRSGSFGVYMPGYRVPLTLSLAEAPLEFGVFLPLGLLGLALTARHLWRERSPSALLLLVWWVLPVLLAIVRPSDFPGGDTFFPRRLWQFASQPLALMAAWALVVAVAPLWRWRPLALTVVGAVAVLAGGPSSWGTWQRLGEFWNDTSFADQDWDLNGGFAYGAWLAERGRAEGPRTVMVPTPDATLVWYLAGQKVVYLYPTAAIKLAFDVQRLTGFGTAEREADLIAAFGGDPQRMAALADKYGVQYLVLRRAGDRLGAVDLPAAALRGARRDQKLRETNHYEWLPIGPDDTIRFQFFSPTDGSAPLTLRARRRSAVPRTAASLVVNGVEFPVSDAEAERDRYVEIARAAPIRAGQNDVRFRANGEFELARFVAYTVPISAYQDRYRVAYQDDATVVLAPK